MSFLALVYVYHSPHPSWNASWPVCQVLIKPKPVFQTAVVSEQTRQLVTETLQQVNRAADIGQTHTASPDGSLKEESGGSGGDGSHGCAQGDRPSSSINKIQLLNSNFPKITNPTTIPSFSRTSACSARVGLQGAGLDWARSGSCVQLHYNLPGGVRWGVPVSYVHH